MALYRRLNDAEPGDVEALAAEMIDRFGPLPEPTANLIKLIEIKHQAIAANVAKIDVGARGTLVTFHNDDFRRPRRPARLRRAAPGHRQAAPGHEAGDQPRVGRRRQRGSTVWSSSPRA